MTPPPPPTTTTLVATDLDGTLVYSRRTRGAGDPAGLHAVEHRDGEPTAWVTHRAARSLADLTRRATWVPATTRTVEQFRRLRVPTARWAVCANGGVLLEGGVPDPAWAARVAAVVDAAAPLRTVAAALAARGRGVLGPLRVADGLFLTARLDRAAVPAGWSDDVGACCAQRGWVAHVGPTKLHALPRGLTKDAAVAELRRRGDASALLAAGDSVLDAGLLADADVAVRPAHGELHDLGWHAEHVVVTSSSGIAAGEEILARLLASTG